MSHSETGAEVDGTRLRAALRAQLERVIAEVRASTATLTSAPDVGSLEVESLVARLRALYGGEPQNGETAPEAPLGAVVMDELVVDLAGHEVRVGSEAVHLTRREFSLLRLLVMARGRALTRDEILQLGWGERDGGSPRTVDIHIHRLRTKLGPPFAQRLQTLRNVGYKLRADAV